MTQFEHEWAAPATEMPSVRQSFVARVNELAFALDGMSIEIDYDSGATVWSVKIEQGIGYTPSFIVKRGDTLNETLEAALEQAENAVPYQPHHPIQQKK